jgi:hypothetical protein
MCYLRCRASVALLVFLNNKLIPATIHSAKTSQPLPSDDCPSPFQSVLTFFEPTSPLTPFGQSIFFDSITTHSLQSPCRSSEVQNARQQRTHWRSSPRVLMAISRSSETAFELGRAWELEQACAAPWMEVWQLLQSSRCASPSPSPPELTFSSTVERIPKSGRPLPLR